MAATQRYPRALDPDVLHRNLALFCATLGTAAPAPHATTPPSKRACVRALNRLASPEARLPLPAAEGEGGVPHYSCDAAAARRSAPLGSLPPARGAEADRVRRAWALIDGADATLGRLMRAAVAAVVTLPEDDARPEGFSRSDAVGVIWARPASSWDDFDFACTLVHECAHSALHLEELVAPLYAVGRAALDATLAHSSIRARPRPYDKALHAAVVSACLARFCAAVAATCTGDDAARREAEIAEHVRDVRASLPSLVEGRFCLTPTGFVHLQQLVEVCGTPAPAVEAPLSCALEALSAARPCPADHAERAPPLALARQSALCFAAENIARFGGEAQALHGERKVLNKYFPPDFDASKIPRTKMDPLRVMKIRMMLPMSICCTTCNNYMYAGTKFNSKKEDVQGPDGRYLGIKIFRFTIKCTVCSAACTFLTDPKNADYKTESGCTRNFEMWREKQAVEQELTAQKAEDEEGDAMRKAEQLMQDSKNEMDILDALDEMRAQNARHEKIDVDGVLDAVHQRAARKAPEDIEAAAKKEAVEAAEDEALVRKNFRSAREGQQSSSSSSDDEAPEPAAAAAAAAPAKPAKSLFSKPALLGGQKKKRPAAGGLLAGVVVKKAKAEAEKPAEPAGGAMGGLLGAYGSDSDSSSD